MADHNRIIIIGLGRMGSALAVDLENAGVPVLGIDKDPQIVQDLAESVRHLAIADATDIEALTQLGLGPHSRVIVTTTKLQQSLLTMTALTDLGVEHIWAKAGSRQHAEILKRLGAERTIQPEADAGDALAEELIARA
ncbi:potassium channel family protein [Kribbia dieselivorans]|uniref:potassium channel family protein n=1 Tax=Kribbia dieselivorans TaxID=331526 RepID=UPI000837E405|nr:NAD-binding protein [Kribbia dieselivorans]